PNVVINGLAIVLSIYVMYPVILDTHAAISARMDGRPPPPTVQAHIDRRATAQAERRARAEAALAASAPPTAGETGDPPPASPAAADALQAEAAARTAPPAVEPERGELFTGVTGGVGPLVPETVPGPGPEADPDAP